METTNMENKKSYELRDLQSKDVFPMLNIIKKIGMKEFKSCFETEEVQKLIAEGESEKTIESIGIAVVIDIADVIFAHISDAEKEIYTFLSGLSGMTKEEISELDMVIFTEMIVDVFQKEQFKDFMKVVSRLFK